MSVLAGIVIVWGLLPPLQDEALIGEQKINTKAAWFLSAPARGSETRKAEDGEDVTVVSVEGKYAKVTIKKDGSTAYIVKHVLIPAKQWQRSAGDEKEGNSMAAQGLEGQKGVNPETEKQWRSKGGPARDQAYSDLDRTMASPEYKGDRPKLEAKLKEFRQTGKLGEFSPVK